MDSFITDPFGLHVDSLNALQMLLRALVAFFSGLFMIRISGLRTLGRGTAFDQLTLLIVGSILGRAIVAGKCFFGNLAAVFLIVMLQRLMAWLSYRSKFMGIVVKGIPRLLVENGIKNVHNMAASQMSEDDIMEDLHIAANTDSLNDIKSAYLERSGHISFIKRKD